MTELQKYLAEEIGTDHAQGLISRREALRRLGLMGLGASAASALLAACAREVAREPSATPSVTQSPAPLGSPIPTEAITFAGPEGRTLKGAWAEASGTKGAVLVIHENRGLNDHIRSVAGRFAGDGFSALAIDLLSEEGGTESFSDPAEASAALGNVPPQRFDADMRAGLSELGRRAEGLKIGAIGFCFGGGMVWRLLDTGDERLAAATPFYGPLPDGADFSGSKAAVLAVYAELDSRVNASRDAAKQALERANVEHQIVTFPGADHAFFNDTGQRYNADAAKKAYEQVIDWFSSNLA
jgi:carboxymethylenebutenolidase